MITIYGCSDDLVEVDGCEGADEFNADNWQADVIAPDGTRMRVHCWYDLNGCWQVGMGQAGEEHQFPDWPVSITQAPAMHPDRPGYSALLSVDAPDGSRLAPATESGQA